MRDGQIEVGFVHKGLDEFMHKIDVVLQPARGGARRRRAGSSAPRLSGCSPPTGRQIFGIHFLSVIGFVVSLVLGGWLLFGVVRSGRL